MAVCPEIDPAPALQFVINAAAGSSDAATKREVVEAALRAGGRRGHLRLRGPAPGGRRGAQLRVVVVHQPVAVTCAEDVCNRLRGHATALQRWAAAGADIVMGGHIHLPCVMSLQDLARPMWALQAGTAVSSRVRKEVPNSVKLLRWGEDPGRAAPCRPPAAPTHLARLTAAAPARRLLTFGCHALHATPRLPAIHDRCARTC